VNEERVASEWMRALRGARSQVAFSRRLGYRTNVAAEWEGGRRSPTAAELFRAAALSGVDVDVAVERFHPQSAAVFRRDGLHAWLSVLLGGSSHTDLAQRAGCSRHQVGRWLRGDAVPRLPDFLRLVDAMTGRMPDLVIATVPVESVPSLGRRLRALRHAERLLFDHPWSPVVLTMLAARDGLSMRELSQCVGLAEADVAVLVKALVAAGLVRRHAGRLTTVRELTSTVRGSQEERHALREHWAHASAGRLKDHRSRDLFGFNVMAVSHADLQRIRERYREFYRDVRAIAAASEPPETAALMVFHLVDWLGPGD
jgi:transcriptional regulator with XRE-family HTH domain/DNA-binding MarR family transcriptional regulator